MKPETNVCWNLHLKIVFFLFFFIEHLNLNFQSSYSQFSLCAIFNRYYWWLWMAGPSWCCSTHLHWDGLLSSFFFFFFYTFDSQHNLMLPLSLLFLISIFWFSFIVLSLHIHVNWEYRVTPAKTSQVSDLQELTKQLAEKWQVLFETLHKFEYHLRGTCLHEAQ